MKLILANIRRLQTLRGLPTDVDLARALKWSKSKVSRVMAGKHGVNDMIVKELARVLKCKEGEIVELDDVAQTPFQREIVAASKRLTREQEAVIRALLGIPPSIPSDR